ncbi:MAG: 3-deoxy-7-phosphoheptulonate synthase [Chloroflexi bacterium RBG_16_50_9]|nr:MAG: 3-deoxy-7-phosphoheptulonate synthase [Chloroflexi bacterium RBG_16_50_9]
MIIMRDEATDGEIDEVIKEIRKSGLRPDVTKGEYRTVIGLVGDKSKIPLSRFTIFPGVKETVAVESPYQLISREYGQRLNGKVECRVVNVKGISIGGGEPVFIAGPCAVESKQQLFKIAEGIKKAGAHILRGGVFKPRSSVHSFQGLGSIGQDEAEEALSWLRDAGDRFGLAVVTEVRGEGQVDLVAKYVDMLQIGTRNMYDQDLLVRAASKHKPILYKRHFGASIEEFLSFAEYIAAEGNKDIVLCERGILPLGKGKSYTRYTLDLAAIPVIQKETYLPVLADPSHATGRRDLIYSMSCAAIAAGASGLMIETHYDPTESLVDSQQMITPDELKEVINACRRIHQLIASVEK